MKRWIVETPSGDARAIDADTATQARKVAESMGIAVENVRQCDDSAVSRPRAAAAVQPSIPAPRADAIDSYQAILVCRKVLNVFGALYAAAGVLLLVTGLVGLTADDPLSGSNDAASSGSDPAAFVKLLGGAFTLAVSTFFFAGGAVIVAIREIALNSRK